MLKWKLIAWKGQFKEIIHFEKKWKLNNFLCWNSLNILICFSRQNNCIKQKIFVLKAENNEKSSNCADPDFCNRRHRDDIWKHSLFQFEMGKFQKLSNSFGMGREVTAQLHSKLIIYGWIWPCNSKIWDKILRKKKDMQCINCTYIYND